MKRSNPYIPFLFSLLIILLSPLALIAEQLSDTCTVHDICQTAIPIDTVIADGGFVCIDGCNLGAEPEVFNNQCMIGLYPTVWYRVITEGGSLMNIHVSSNDIESPTITLFQSLSGCNSLVQIPLSQGNIPCVIGNNGVAEAIGTDIGSNVNYFIAVSSYDTLGGTFSICVNTISVPSICVTDRTLKVVARSEGGDLSGPFKPGEVVSICMNVNSYSASGNGCQWFQGLVPVFGNGWDPTSFNNDGQPLNATINGNPIGEAGNGLYSESTWDWFTDVDYHYTDLKRFVGDLDGNGTLEMCSELYDPDCPTQGGIIGGCCGPCWGSPLGTILPPGWFSYGINGSCATPGPPIRVDWGDGNTCGSGMGPWSFCFDLMVRSYPDCLEDETTSDLSLGFFTFADGETGSWTGAASNCSQDQPAAVMFSLQCGIETDLGIEVAEDICADNLFEFTISEPGIEEWTWSIFPAWAIKHSAKAGANGFAISDTVVNTFSSPVDVTYFFTGYVEGSSNTVVKQVRFRIIPGIRSPLPEIIYVCERDKDSLVISAEPVTGGRPPYQFNWLPGGNTTSAITIFPPFESSLYTLEINDSLGCKFKRDIQFKVRPCQLDTIIDTDESNDGHTFEDPPPFHGNKITFKESETDPTDLEPSGLLKIFPQPASDLVNIDWTDIAYDAEEIIITDTKGAVIHRSRLSIADRRDHRAQLSIGSYARGVYFVLLPTAQSVLAGRMVKIY